MSDAPPDKVTVTYTGSARHFLHGRKGEVHKQVAKLHKFARGAGRERVLRHEAKHANKPSP